MSRARTQYNKSWSFLTNDSDEKQIVEAKIKSIEKKEGRKLSVSEALRLIIISSNGHHSENVSLPPVDTIPDKTQDSKQELIPPVISNNNQDNKPVDAPSKSLWDELNIDGI